MKIKFKDKEVEYDALKGIVKRPCLDSTEEIEELNTTKEYQELESKLLNRGIYKMIESWFR